MKRLAPKFINPKKLLNLGMNLHLSLTAALMFLLPLTIESRALCATHNDPLVEVEVRGDTVGEYKLRRADHGVYVGIHKEDISFTNYLSVLDSKSYLDMFGEEPLSMALLTVDYKFNYSFGSLAVGLEAGKGSVKDNLSGAERSLNVFKKGINLKFTADMIFGEPYIAPYVGLTFWQLEVSETSPVKDISDNTQMGMNYTAGLLLQLNWLDLDTSRVSRFNWGLENTFIDMYVTQYGKTTAIGDPDTETDAIYGAGVRLEF